MASAKRKKGQRKGGASTGRVTPPKAKRPAHDEEFEVAGVRVVRDGRTITWKTTEEFDPVAMRRMYAERATVAAERSNAIIAELRELVASVNALHLVGQVASWATIGDTRVDDVAQRFGVDAQAEFLAAVAVESGSPDGELAGPGQVNRALMLLDELFKTEDERILGEETANGGDGETFDEARFYLRHESVRYRMRGYIPHLSEIIESVFERIRADCVSAVGFCPADVPRLVGAHFESRQTRFEDLIERARQGPQEHLADLSESPGFALLSWVIFVFNDPIGDMDSATLADLTGVPADQTEAALRAMTTPWNQPASDLRPGRITSVRRRPVLEGHDGRFSWPLAWSSLQEELPWFDGVLAEGKLVELREAVRKARSDGTEEIVTERLTGIFGPDRVHRSFEYPIEGRNWAECDVVVRLPGHALAVECKSGSLNDEYRTGNSGFVSSTFHTLVEHPFEQSTRAVRFLTAGPGKWRVKGTKQKHAWPGVPSATRIAVSLERIDPLALIAARAQLSKGAGDPGWVVCLPDLLMIADILDDMHTFFAYARLRSDLAADPSVAVISEADLLGAFLNDRLRLFRQALSLDAETRMSLTHHAQVLNKYFTTIAVGFPAPKKPGVRVSRKSRQRLDALWDADNPAWASEAQLLVAQR